MALTGICSFIASIIVQAADMLIVANFILFSRIAKHFKSACFAIDSQVAHLPGDG